MHKLSNFAGGVRHGWEIPFRSQHHDQRNPTFQRPHQHTPITNTQSPLSWCFKVPLNNSLTGPDPKQIIYASQGAQERWTFPEGEQDDQNVPAHQLPVHQQHLEDLKAICNRLKSELGVEPIVTSGRAAAMTPILGLQPTQSNNVVANVCVHGRDYDIVRKVREYILNNSPITMQSAVVPVDRGMIIKGENSTLDTSILQWLDDIHRRTKADIFLLDPEERNEDGSPQANSKEQLKIVIYGDMMTKENAKVHALVMIDRKLLNLHVETMQLDLNLHSLICGRARKKIKAIESATDTAIYLPPIFPRVHTFVPEGAERRDINEIVITGPDSEHIFQAKAQLSDLALSAKVFAKDVRITLTKMDHLLLERLDKIQSIMEAHASHLILPSIGQQINVIRVQGLDVLNVERTIRDVMGLTTQFYSAEWQCIGVRAMPPSDQLALILSDICSASGADIVFTNNTFYAFGSDEACRTALNVISQIPFVKNVQSTIHIKLELANEHKEFVSGKKNGKINKIMNTASVQIVFDGFNEYNFYIDVRGNEYPQTMHGLELVEAELPASLSFHVPDQYHKRIIGIGGQHIQQLMKKYSVFVKFSNAHDRGPVVGKEDDTLKLDNVICRTPSRNAQNLELVKQEIMDMVNRPDAEQVTEQVTINRLLHRELVSSRMSEIERLEKMWNCKITFPSTEQASDVVLISGPEFQVPNAIYGLLSMVPESHEIAFTASKEIQDYINSPEFNAEIVDKLNHQYGIECTRIQGTPNPDQPDVEKFVLSYTRNDAGALKDAIDFLISQFIVKGLDISTVKGNLPRPKSDSFEDSLPYFDSKLLHRKAPTAGTDSPTRSAFNEAIDNSESASAGFFAKFRRPGMSSFTSLIDRRKNANGNSAAVVTNANFFKHASSNASKASLASIESQNSGYRNWWNDSGINLPEEDTSATHTNGWPLPHTPLPLPPGHPFAQQHLHSSNTSSATTPVSSHPPSFAFGQPQPMHSNHSNLYSHLKPIGGGPGDATPTSRYDPRASVDSGRPSTSNSLSGYPGPLSGIHR